MRDSNGVLIPDSVILSIKKDILVKYPDIPVSNYIQIVNITISGGKYKAEYVTMGMSNYSYHEVDIKYINRVGKFDDLGI